MIKGRHTLRIAIAVGQYTHPSGLFYGGCRETWSNKALQEIVARHLSSSKRVAFVDIHTGLGPYGECTLISRFPGGSSGFERISTWWGSHGTSAVTLRVCDRRDNPRNRARPDRRDLLSGPILRSMERTRLDTISVRCECRDQPLPEGLDLWSIRRLLGRDHVIGRLDRQ